MVGEVLGYLAAQLAVAGRPGAAAGAAGAGVVIVILRGRGLARRQIISARISVSDFLLNSGGFPNSLFRFPIS